MRGSADRGARTEPGWYPDYAAPPGHQRFWDGERWTERRRADPAAAPAAAPAADSRSGGRRSGWLAAVAVLAVVVAAVVVGRLVTGDDAPRAVPASSAPTSGAAPSSSSPSSTPSRSSGDGRLLRVAAVVDGHTIELDDQTQVRLVGIAAPLGITCATSALFELAELVDGELVSLVRRGPDTDAEGHLLRYVERDGVDVGLRLIQRGLARATDEAHARGPIYRRVDARTDAAC